MLDHPLSDDERAQLEACERVIHRLSTEASAQHSQQLEAIAAGISQPCPECGHPAGLLVRGHALIIVFDVAAGFQPWHDVCHEACEGYGWRDHFASAKMDDLLPYARSIAEADGWILTPKGWRSPPDSPRPETILPPGDETILDIAADSDRLDEQDIAFSAAREYRQLTSARPQPAPA